MLHATIKPPLTRVRSPGYGADTIDEFGYLGYIDTVKLKTGIAVTDIQLTRIGEDVVLKIAGTTDQLTFYRQVALNLTATARTENIIFADGTTWTEADIRSKLLVATAGNDSILGYGSDDTINGLAGDDTINAGTGNDTIAGGAGWDTMTGGAGNDRFVFTSAAEIGILYGQNDTIADFAIGVDKIDLSALDANVNAAGDQTFTFIGANFMAAVPGQLRFVQYDNTGTGNDYTEVRGDSQGDLAADFNIRLNGLIALTASDFAL